MASLTPSARPAAPAPTLIEALRQDNHDQFLEILNINSFSTSAVTAASSGTVTQPKQRLIFATESLRRLFLSHILPGPNTRASNVTKKNKKKAPGSSSSKGIGLTHEEESLGLTAHNPYRIVGTRVLLPEYPTHYGTDGYISSTSEINSTVVENSFETIYNPRNNSSSSEQEDEKRDAKDGATIISYFIQPTIPHVRAVCQKIKQLKNKRDAQSLSSTTNPFDNSYPSSSSSNAYSSTKLKHQIVFLPHTNALSKRILSDESITTMKDVSIYTLAIDLIPLEDDVLTCLDTDSILKDCDVEGIPSDHVTTVAKSLIKVQDVVGIVPRVQSFGVLGEMVLQKMISLRMEEFDPFTNIHNQDGEHGNAGVDSTMDEFISKDIQAMVILDRKVDLVTPMVTGLTYEALLDDILKIEAGFTKVDANIIDPPEDAENTNTAQGTATSSTTSDNDKPKNILLPLNDLDTLYAEVRDQHVEKFGSFLQGQAKALKESHSNFSDKNKDLTEIHQFVKQIPIFTQSLKSLTNHIHLAELIKHTTEQSEFRQRWQTERSMVESESCYEIMEDLIASQYPPFRILRLLCLQSLTSGGLKSAKYETLRRDVVQTYGYEFLLTLQNLEKLGLIRKRETMWMETATAFTTLRKHLSLIQADVDTLDPDDVSFVSSGYAPISIRILQTAIKGWAGKEEALRELPGRSIDIEQESPPTDFSSLMKQPKELPSLGVLANTTTSFSSLSKSSDDVKEKEKPVLLVYFVGGVTYMEIAALRFLSKTNTFPYRIVCCTTKIINGSTLLQSLM